MVPVRNLKQKGIQLLCYFQLVYFNGIITVKISVDFLANFVYGRLSD